MKQIKLIAFLFLIGTNISWAQNIIGQWTGKLKLPTAQLQLRFNIAKTGDSYTCTMDSPEQGANGIPAKATIDTKNVKIEITAAKIEYEGTIIDDKNIKGVFKQSGIELPLDLTKNEVAEKQVVHYQTPQPPFNYYSEDVVFPNKKDTVQLAGTLTLPKKNGVFAAVVLVTGSGPQNRNEELMGHQPFAVIADYLTKNGIAVLRYDDRGVGASKGNFAIATTTNFANDANAAVQYLLTRKEINKTKIGIMGHSEGGIIAPMVAAQNKNVAFIVMLAGSGVDGGEVLLEQKKLIEQGMGISPQVIDQGLQTNKGAFALIKKISNTQVLKDSLQQYFAGSSMGNLASEQQQMIATLTTPWMINFIKYNPAVALKKVTCPVLYLFGEKDLQVPPQQNASAIANALTNNKKATQKIYPNLNHLFQHCSRCTPDEYGKIEETFSTEVLQDILKFITQQAKSK